MAYPFSAAFAWLKQALTPTPAQLAADKPIARDRPIYEQFQRIGGGVTPATVTSIIRTADGGQPAQLVDLMNESRQKDGHLQGVLSTRERAPGLIDLEFVPPKDATDKERAAVELCRRIRDGFANWPELISHLNGFLFGHASAELKWEAVSGGWLLPTSAKLLHARDFIFAISNGALRYRRYDGDVEGIDLLVQFPGRVIQIQRKIVHDVPAREGLARLLIWAALLRNWGLRDWVALGEIGWKPWRIGKYKPGTHIDDIEKFVEMLERLGHEGIGVHSKDDEVVVEWPKGNGPGIGTHRELFDTLGREQSKAVLGQTTSTEAGSNGDQRGSEVRDLVRQDIAEEDCRAIASALRYCLFAPAVALNLGADVRCPVPVFQTDEGQDIVEFAQAMNTLRLAGVRIPAPWVRDQVGIPHPIEGEELVNELAMIAEEGRTLGFLVRAWVSGGHHVKNAKELAKRYNLDVEFDEKLLEAQSGGGEAEAA